MPGASRAVEGSDSEAGECLPPHQALLEQRHEQLVPELLADEGVQDGVYGAMNEGQNNGDVQGQFYAFLPLTRFFKQLRPHEHVDQFGDVVWEPADHEGQDNTQDDSHGLVLLAVAGVAEGSHRPAIAEKHDDQGQEEAKCVPKNQQSYAPVVHASGRHILVADHSIEMTLQGLTLDDLEQPKQAEPQSNTV